MNKLNNNQQILKTTRRGRPPKSLMGYHETKEALIRAGIIFLTEKGFSATGIDEILKSVKVPKGSFYHFFENKNAFGITLIDRYAEYYRKKLNLFFLDESISPLQRLHAYIQDSQRRMTKYEYKRGCLIGNLGQEMGYLTDSFRERLVAVLEDWQLQLSLCLQKAQQIGELPASANCDELAYAFWTGWEGAVLRSKLEQSNKALEAFGKLFFDGLPK